MLRKAQTTAEKMIKVDHTGENGAVNIYRGQCISARLRAPKLIAQLKDFQSHEEEHREIFRKHLKTSGLKKCTSYHLCGLGGLVLGLVTGLIGPSAIAATTYAVEHVVLEHLEHQLSYLQGKDPAAYEAVSAIYEDEKEHHDTAQSQMQSDKALTRSLITIVSLCTNGVIKFGMR